MTTSDPASAKRTQPFRVVTRFPIGVTQFSRRKDAVSAIVAASEIRRAAGPHAIVEIVTSTRAMDRAEELLDAHAQALLEDAERSEGSGFGVQGSGVGKPHPRTPTRHTGQKPRMAVCPPEPSALRTWCTWAVRQWTLIRRWLFRRGRRRRA